MLDSALDLVAILSLVCAFLAVVLFRALGRIRRLERLYGVRSRRRRRRLPKEAHIREIPVRFERRRAG